MWIHSLSLGRLRFRRPGVRRCPVGSQWTVEFRLAIRHLFGLVPSGPVLQIGSNRVRVLRRNQLTQVNRPCQTAHATWPNSQTRFHSDAKKSFTIGGRQSKPDLACCQCTAWRMHRMARRVRADSRALEFYERSKALPPGRSRAGINGCMSPSAALREDVVTLPRVSEIDTRKTRR
jgi:hypothetical protein